MGLVDRHDDPIRIDQVTATTAQISAQSFTIEKSFR